VWGFERHTDDTPTKGSEIFEVFPGSFLESAKNPPKVRSFMESAQKKARRHVLCAVCIQQYKESQFESLRLYQL
jgi:hypothetical protein